MVKRQDCAALCPGAEQLSPTDPDKMRIRYVRQETREAISDPCGFEAFLQKLFFQQCLIRRVSKRRADG